MIQQNADMSTSRRQVLRLVGGGVTAVFTATATGGCQTASPEKQAPEPPDGHTAGDTADDALATRRAAVARRDELDTLAGRDELDIDNQLFESVEQNIAAGDAEFKVGDYAAAKKVYATAREQARAGLKPAYFDGARTLLAADEDYLQELEQEGYIKADVSEFEKRIDKLKEDLAAADTLADHRRVYRNARDLHQEVRRLPQVGLVKAVDTVNDGWPWLAGGLAVISGIAYGIKQRFGGRRGPGGTY